MSKINSGRVVMGGLLAGVVLNVFDFLVHGLWLANRWNAALAALGAEEMAGSAIGLYVAWDFVLGIFMVWLYAAIRPRYGSGPKTALLAGLATWFSAVLLNAVGQAPLGLFPVQLFVLTSTTALIYVPLAALAGAWLYKEAAEFSAPAL